MSTSQTLSPQRFPGLRVGLTASLILHLGFMASILSVAPEEPPTSGIMQFEVSFIPQPQSQQIVTIAEPTTSTDSPPPLNTRFEAEHSVTTPREQVRRAPPGSPAPAQKAEQNRQVKPEQKTRVREAQRKSSASLLLDSGTTLSEFGEQKSDSKIEDNPVAIADSYQAFSRPSGTGAAILGFGGTLDYLPHLPDGDITLLNAKANQFAVFVRRVAERVFSRLRLEGWEALSTDDIRKVRDFTEVRATLSPSGELLSIELILPSGSTRFDAIVERAARGGSNDPHPPKGAEAADGLIHFVFKAKSWSKGAIAPRSGALYERRWLLLATGLE